MGRRGGGGGVPWGLYVKRIGKLCLISRILAPSSSSTSVLEYLEPLYGCMYRHEEGSIYNSSDWPVYSLTYRRGINIYRAPPISVGRNFPWCLKQYNQLHFLSISNISFKLWHLHRMTPSWVSPNNAKMSIFLITVNGGQHVPKTCSDGLYILYTCILRYVHT